MKRTADGWIATSIRTLHAPRVYRPSTIEEAVEMFERSDAPAVMAGGTDLVAQFNEGFAPSAIISLRKIDALHGIRLIENTLHIGSCVTHATGSGSDLVRGVAPGFAQAWGRIANARVRLSATIGGNIMARRTRYEMPILLRALGGTAHFSGPLLVEVRIPLDGLVAFDYDRSLRPILTHAVCLRRAGDGSLAFHAAIGTEAAEPFGFSAPFYQGNAAWPAIDTKLIAGAAYETFPREFADVYSSNAYLRRAGHAILERQLKRLVHAAA